MSAPRLNLHRDDDGRVVSVGFVCPGCGGYHQMGVRQVGHAPVWSWNGDVERPTLAPSILWTSGHYSPGWKQGDPCWCTYNAERPGQEAPFTCERCHSFVRDGRVQFLNDCTHALAGQTVDLPEVSQ